MFQINQEQCDKVLCGQNNNGEAWFHQGSFPLEKKVHSSPARIKHGKIKYISNKKEGGGERQM